MLATILLLLSCNKNVEDSSELWEKAQTSGEIIARSGTVFNPAQNKERAMRDAENRLRTGGGLFGTKAGISWGTKEDNNNTFSSIGMPINPYLWKGSLETIDFMPLLSADPFGGIIITDWYSDGQTLNERCKINIFIKGLELNTNNLKVNAFCQSFENNNWIDLPIDLGPVDYSGHFTRWFTDSPDPISIREKSSNISLAVVGVLQSL